MRTRFELTNSLIILTMILIVTNTVVKNTKTIPREEPKGPIFGVNTSKLDSEGASEIKYIGVKTVRTDSFAWDIIEPRRGVYDFTVADLAVIWAQNNNFDLLGILLYTPPWESGASFIPNLKLKSDCGIPTPENLENSPDEFRVLPPNNPDEFAKFVFETVKRYPTVKHWQIWNEPNNPIFWQPKPDSRAYARLLQKAYIAVKKANPDAQVVLGGISLVDLEFLENLYSAGVKDYFDILAVHPYNPAQSPAEYVKHELLTLKNVMDKHGDAEKKIWLTEISWHTSTAPKGISEKTQGKYVKELFDVTRSLDFVGGVFWNTLEDCDLNSDKKNPEHNSGLFRSNSTPKPGADVYREMLR